MTEILASDILFIYELEGNFRIQLAIIRNSAVRPRSDGKYLML